ncbi:MAG: NAD(+)/NADH kinase [bacterium]
MTDNAPRKPARILIVYNPHKNNALTIAGEARDILNQAGILTTLQAYQPHPGELDEPLARQAREFDVVLVLGGDGTILGVARQTAENPRPIMGVNLGGFGFLTAAACHELEQALQCLITGNYRTQNRFFLEARVERPAKEEITCVFHSLALNEALITLSQPGRLLKLWLGESEESALAYRADGIIIATPNGSTGHSLSAGGPILEPHLPALVITPVSPHSLFNRPLVIGGEKELRIWFQEHTADLVLILDGQIRTTLHSSDRVIVQRSKHTVPTISMPERAFSQVLRYKFNLGESV